MATSPVNTPLGTVERVIQVAQSQVGVVEGPKNNQTIYGAYTKANYLPWCGSFQNWVFNQAGVKIPNVVGTIAGAQAFQKAGCFFTSDPQVGDLVFMSWAGKLRIQDIEHIGLVIKILPGGLIQTIEGNTSKAGSQANGGEVVVQTRAYTKNAKGLTPCVVGFGRPNYAKATAKPATPAVVPVVTNNAYRGHTIAFGEVSDDVKFVQKKLGVSTVDGQFGPVTQKAVQHFQDTFKPRIGESDGVVGPKTWKALLSL